MNAADESPTSTTDSTLPELDDAFLISTVEERIPPVVEASNYGPTGGVRGIPAALAAHQARSMVLAALALLLVTGFVAASQMGGGDPSTLGHEPAGDGTDELALAAPPAGPDSAEENGAEPAPPPDRDGDGVLDVDDNCPDLANQEQADLDGDALGDDCDSDDDNDRTPDESDNCPVDVNDAQNDVDADGLGDVCDDFPDLDQDGVIDTEDSCIELPDDLDTDGDGTPDKCDATPRGMVVTGASARIDRVTILDEDSTDADMFGDLVVAGRKFELPEISNQREVRPDNWLSDEVGVEAGSPQVRVRVWIRDESGFCLFCKDELVDLTPVSGSNQLHLVIDTATGVVELANENWDPLGPIGTLTGPDDGNLSGTITQQGDDNSVHLGSTDVSLTLIRQPAP